MTQTDQPRSNSLGSRVVKWALVLALVLLIAAVVSRGIDSRTRASSVVKEETRELAIPSVSIVHPRLGDARQELVLPGNLQAFTDAPVYARTSGYLKKWYADIGTPVKANQVLAEIDAPEQ